MRKKAIKYIRYSSDDQSLHSTERQDLVISSWVKYNDIDVIDSFKDEGYSARTFDRPDVKQLFAFIRKNSRNIDYLIVSELTRFSRETGDAINMVKEIQQLYGIRIVSASRSQIYDCNDSNSFFMMGLEFLLGNSENIKRQSDINGGIYTAKTEKGRYIGAKAPYGYMKVWVGKERKLAVNEDQAEVVRSIFNSFLNNVPIIEIKKQARKKGFLNHGNDSIIQVLTNPVHMGFQYVKPWKNMKGGLFPLHDHTNIVEPDVWYKAQSKLKTPGKNISLRDDLPLRQLLKCHCSEPLTGAPSRGKGGKYFLYYKCKHSKHNNISAVNAHKQLEEIMQLLSLPDYMITSIRAKAKVFAAETMKAQQTKLRSARLQLEQTEKDLHSVEGKWIRNEMPADTFHRWYQDLSSKRINIKSQIETLCRDEHEKWFVIEQEIEKLSDMRYLYNNIGTTDKQELLRKVFDDSLYYENKVYRTPYMMEMFTHNAHILKQHNLLILDKWDYLDAGNPVRWS